MASLIGALAQLVERFAGSEEVSGSNPLGSTSFRLKKIARGAILAKTPER